MKLISMGTFATVALICSALESSGQNLNGAYRCSGEASSGLRLDKASKKWRAASLDANERFIVRLNFVERPQGQHGAPDPSYYEVNISDPGIDLPIKCYNTGAFLPVGVPRTNVEVDDNLKFDCADDTRLNVYRFNLKIGKYLSFYTAGGGLDPPNTDTPNVTMGTCTKIDKAP